MTKMNVDPGKLDKKIKIILRTTTGETKNGFAAAKAEQLIRDCWAQVTNTSGKELTANGQKLSEAKKRFLVRDNGTKITTAMVVRYNNHEYDIKYVNSYGDGGEYLEIWTEWQAPAAAEN